MTDSSPAGDAGEAVDGRRLRRTRNSDAVVGAMLELLREGHLRPGAQEIADRAGVSLRTVFRHFQDLDVLFAIAVERQFAHVRPLLVEPAPNGSLDERIDAVVEHRRSLYEDVGPVRRAAVRAADFHEPLRAGLAYSHKMLRRQLARAFETELAAVGSADRERLLDALDVATSWAAWETLRWGQELTAARAAAVVGLTLRGLLDR